MPTEASPVTPRARRAPAGGKPKPSPADSLKGKSKRPFGTLTVALVTEAMMKSAGIQSHAAQRLGVNRTTVWRFIQAHPEMQDVIDEVNEITNDIAESELLKAIKAGDQSAVRFRLTHKAKDRGYGQKPIELGGIDGAAIKLEQVNADAESFTRAIAGLVARQAESAGDGEADAGGEGAA